MKKIIKKVFIKIIFCIAIIGLICLTKVLDVLDFNAMEDNIASFDEYTGYYFNELDLKEKQIYIKLDKAARETKNTIFLGIYADNKYTEDISKVIEAYFYDNPECYNLSNEYTVSAVDFKVFKITTINLKYLALNTEKQVMDAKLEQAMDNLLNKCITQDMTDFEKEVAIHDELVKRVSYYQYEDVNKIPLIKHTAYGALVENEAVCDGYSKAFKLLLEKVGIESIIVSGNVDETLHAWNIVKIEDDYYHVDATSDKIHVDSETYVIHRYFNITDEEILKTHKIGEKMEIPNCIATKYNYYIQNGYYISDSNNVKVSINEILLKQRYSACLEILVNDKIYLHKIIDTLYELDFNKWNSNRTTTVSYHKLDNVYVFIKNNK